MDYSLPNERRVRDALLIPYRAALVAVEGGSCVREALRARPVEGPIWAVAIGKAAGSMLSGAFSELGTALQRALLITKYGYGPTPIPPRTELIEAAHPLPDANSLLAGSRLLEFVRQAPADIRFLFLLSGGASSLVEVLPPGVTLDDLQRANTWLLGSGLPIENVNAVRRRLSCIKGGRLRAYLGNQPVRALLMSDVADDDPRTIGSGLLHGDGGMDALPASCPAWLTRWLDSAQPVATSAPLMVPDTEIVANLEQALAAAALAAEPFGQPILRHRRRLDGDAAAAGQMLADDLIQAEPGFHIWGGETTVRLPAAPGVGGRCQQLALAAAQTLAGHAHIHMLVAATDGSDGPTSTAGALVDSGTLERGRREGLNAEAALANADAGTFLAAAGDLIDTGPTGSNVNDIVIALKLPESAAHADQESMT